MGAGGGYSHCLRQSIHDMLNDDKDLDCCTCNGVSQAGGGGVGGVRRSEADAAVEEGGVRRQVVGGEGELVVGG